MRSTQLFLLAAAAASAAHAQTTTSSPDVSLSPVSSSYLAAESSIFKKLANFQTASEGFAVHSDAASWDVGWFSTQTALPTDISPQAPGNHDLANAFQHNYIQKMVDLLEEKQYMADKADQSSVVEVLKEYQTMLREAAGTYASRLTETAKSGETTETAKSGETTETAKSGETTAAAGAEEEEGGEEEKEDEDSAAGRVGGVGALAAVLVSGLLGVVAL